MIDYSFYLVADPHVCGKRKLTDIVMQAVAAGVTCVQLRIKTVIDDEVKIMAKKVLSLLELYKIPLIINDHVELACELDADGVHIGQTDMSFKQARTYLGKGKIIGLSINTIAQAKHCQLWDVDYLGVGPVFTTTTKQDAAAPIGIAGLKTIAGLVNKPIVAIGGINTSNVAKVHAVGVAGVAVVSAIMAASDPYQATKTLRKLI